MFHLAYKVSASVHGEQGLALVRILNRCDVPDSRPVRGITLSVKAWDNVKFYTSTINTFVKNGKDTPEPIQLDEDIYMSHSVFKGKTCIHLRHWSKGERSGKIFPTSKGISLDSALWAGLKYRVAEIDGALKEMIESLNLCGEEFFSGEDMSRVPSTKNANRRKAFLNNAIMKAYIREIVPLIAEVAKEKCGGCEIDDPSQDHHDCMMIEEGEQIEMYFEKALKRVDEEAVLNTFTAFVNNQTEIPVHPMYLMKYDCEDWRETELKTATWKQGVITAMKILSKDYC